MASRDTLCVEFSAETTEWLAETAEACNTTPEDVVRLLVIAPVFMENQEEDTDHALGNMPDAVGDSGKTQVLIREALSKIYDVTQRQALDNQAIRKEVRSMFEMMDEA
ncbi:hypothetical protein CRI94_13475 [Longibacter salinarum]|uniref:Uncharacterized protein n=1 Tax=Longibacter salinarum TaxID=1850348 RepID=A0A2A8CV14_9BACT|nr:hypothetical protein [Longibacter salinarum]PEN12532.1 hypothetical protein CRI94_13475 [Longibacter salinarum]